MDFTPFDKSKLDAYTAEAKARWGKTEAWSEFEQKTAGQSREEQSSSAAGLMDIFARFGQSRRLAPEGAEAQALVAELQAFITGPYYTCTPQILRGLGQMYAAGGEMTDNIDAAGGPGTGEFACKAIAFYCKSAQHCRRRGRRQFLSLYLAVVRAPSRCTSLTKSILGTWKSRMNRKPTTSGRK